MSELNVPKFRRMGGQIADALRKRLALDEHGTMAEEDVLAIRLEVTQRSIQLLQASDALTPGFYSDATALLDVMALCDFVRTEIHTLSVERPICPEFLRTLLSQLERMPIMSPVYGQRAGEN